MLITRKHQFDQVKTLTIILLTMILTTKQQSIIA